MSKTLKKPLVIKTNQGNKTLKISNSAEKLKKKISHSRKYRNQIYVKVKKI